MTVRHADRPLPQWYDDAKFGIFIHWGAYGALLRRWSATWAT